jgi:hypothetical protein
MTKGLYVQYLERLAVKREAAGLPPAPDVHDDEYWSERRQIIDGDPQNEKENPKWK